MSGSSFQATTSSTLPRGLMSKSGLPLNPNQRLPSLRSSLTKPNLLFHSNSSLTSPSTILRGSVGKRTFKPTVPETRKQNESTSNYHNGNKKGSGDWKSSPSIRPRRLNTRKPKKLVQLESTVFTGAPRSSQEGKISGDKTRQANKQRKQKSRIISPEPVFENEVEDQSAIEEKLLQDDFIERSSDDDDERGEQLPQGWKNLSLPLPEKPRLRDDHWLTSDKDDKFILFQLPKFFDQQTDMKIGKLRIYASGKVELVDNPSGLSFDVVKTGQKDSPLIKEEASDDIHNKGCTEVLDKQKSPKINRDVVVYSGRNLTCLGKLEPDAAIVVPQILDER